jgi:HAD superfamily hydrolase (TIGR01662 family)
MSFHPILRNARAVVFDAGGTIVHPDWRRLAQLVKTETGQEFTSHDMRRAFYQMLRDLDQELRNGSDLKHMNAPHSGFIRTFRVLGVDESACNRIRAKLTVEHQQRHLWCEADAEASDVLAQLKDSGLRLAVISNTEDGRLEDSLTLADVASHFEFLIDSHLVGYRKPDAAIFQLAVERMGLKAQEVVYVGDSYGIDVVGAQQAGLQSILLDRSGACEDLRCSRIGKLSELTDSD